MLTQIVDDIQVMTELDTMREPDPMKVPATALWGVSISDTDLEKLKAGHIPEDQDDKWLFYATEEPLTVHIVRSALHVDCYVLHIVIKPGDDSSSGSSAEIVSITWETNRGCLTGGPRGRLC